MVEAYSIDSLNNFTTTLFINTNTIPQDKLYNLLNEEFTSTFNNAKININVVTGVIYITSGYSILIRAGLPQSFDSNDGDYYINNQTNTVYFKFSGKWNAISTLNNITYSPVVGYTANAPISSIIQAINAAPSSAPPDTIPAGTARIVVDVTNNKIWVWTGTAWKGVAIA